MNEKQLQAITEYLKEKVWRCEEVMFPEIYEEDISDLVYDLVDIISSLHNLLYESVTGSRYNYAFHWTNKIGCDTIDHIFDLMIKENEE